MKITNFETKQHLFEFVCSNLAGNVAISGGKSPIELYKHLNTNLTNKTSFWLVDERIVKRESPDSNWGNISEAMPNFALNEFETLPDFLDICCLGFGDDGHFASIFEGFDDWKSNKKFLYTTASPTYSVQKRISLSPNYIKSSEQIWVLLIGDKQQILQKFLSQAQTPNNFLYNLPNLQVLCAK